MAWKRYYRRHYRKYSGNEDLTRDAAKILTVVIVLFGFYIYKHPQQVIQYGSISLGILLIGYILYFLFKRRRQNEGWHLEDDKTLYMLKGMSPSEFENEVAKMFTRLGYKTEVIGGANDGGIDVLAHKDNKKYFIQCKKFISQEVTPHDVRDFLGTITNVNNPAEKGFFITTGGFTLMAERAAEGNPRIELIDGTKLVQYYKNSYKEAFTEGVPVPISIDSETRKCPQCGGDLQIRTAHKGDYAGKQFLGCSNFPKCKFIKNI